MHVCHIISNLADGGAEAVLFRLCINDKRNRHTVISMMDKAKYGPLLEERGVTVYNLNMSRGSIPLGSLVRLWRLIRSQRVDLVQTWMYHADFLGGVIARLAGVPVVWGIRHSDLVPGKSKQRTIRIAHWCSRLSYLIPRFIVCCSERAGRLHQEHGYSAPKITVIPNGYDLDVLHPEPTARRRLRNELEIEDSVPLLGMIARFDPQKDHRNLIRALGSLNSNGQSFRCVLIGAGMEYSNTTLTGWLESEDIQDRVLLFSHRNDIPAVMNALDIHTLSSAYGEAFPNVLCEAMACGTPCVTTDVGDAAFIVGDTGWVVPPGSSEKFHGALSEALGEWSRGESWRTRQAAARNRILENFTMEQMLSSYRDVWSSAIA